MRREGEEIHRGLWGFFTLSALFAGRGSRVTGGEVKPNKLNGYTRKWRGRNVILPIITKYCLQNQHN